jgi:isoamylase
MTLPAGPELGARRAGGAVEFAVHARARSGVVVEIFQPGGASPIDRCELAPDDTFAEPFRVWRGSVRDAPERFEYVLRVDGGPPLVDPHAVLLAGGEVWGRSSDALAPGVGRRYRGLFAPPAAEPPGGAASRPTPPAAGRVLYELHVRGFTRHESSGVRSPGSFPGVIEKLPHLLDLGVTTLELLPVFEFDETENPRRDPGTGDRLLNFWGYSPVSFFAPKAAYGSSGDPEAARDELRTLVDEAHRAGIEVVLDVVYNHTAEGAGGAGAPTHSWRGLDVGAYYLLDPADGRALDFTGCGNTVNAVSEVGRHHVLESLRHWVRDYGIDGFRFDLAATLFRGAGGEKCVRSPLAEAIASDPVLADRLLIAEPWDATGFTPENGFPAPWWEWDGEFRDGLRAFVGAPERSSAATFARRMSGRGPHGGKLPAGRTVRFAACHDGRPLADVPVYAAKHNRANGEDNRDGWDGEVAWNGGHEGPTDDRELGALRERQIRALLALLGAAPGTPLLAAGDELGRTQRGNTNAWCRDDEIGWVVWPAGPVALHGFTRALLGLRRELVATGADRAAPTAPFQDVSAAVGAEGDRSFLVLHAGDAGSWLVAANAGTAAVRFPLPKPPAGSRWRLRLDTTRAAGEEIPDRSRCPELADGTTELEVAPGSVRIFLAVS